MRPATSQAISEVPPSDTAARARPIAANADSRHVEERASRGGRGESKGRDARTRARTPLVGIRSAQTIGASPEKRRVESSKLGQLPSAEGGDGLGGRVIAQQRPAG